VVYFYSSSPRWTVQFSFCIATYGALQFISTCLAPSFTGGHSCIAPTELHFIYNNNLSVKSVEFVVGRLKLFRIKEILVEKEPRRGEIIMTPGPAAADGGSEEVFVFRAP
jgi:hypothetical protein